MPTARSTSTATSIVPTSAQATAGSMMRAIAGASPIAIPQRVSNSDRIVPAPINASSSAVRWIKQRGPAASEVLAERVALVASAAPVVPAALAARAALAVPAAVAGPVVVAGRAVAEAGPAAAVGPEGGDEYHDPWRRGGTGPLRRPIDD